MPRRRGLTSCLLVLFFILSFAAPSAAQEGNAAEEDLEKLAVEANNPVGNLWMITNQFNLNRLKSDTVRMFKDHQNLFIWNVQPVMPIELTKDVRVIVRPVIPLVNMPVLDGRRDIRYTSGISDIGLQALLAPNTNARTGFMWGAGPTAVAPTAANHYLGQGKWQAGPAATALYITDKWVVGAYGQHWWSFAGDSARSNVSYTKLQYFLWYSPVLTWQVGMGPNVTIDWNRPKAEDRLTLPVGLGVSKIFRLGKLPIKITLEADYSVVRPRNVPGNEWNFHLNFTPIIKSLL